MFTEAELRDALHHSAARADALPTPAGSTPMTPIHLVVEPDIEPMTPAPVSAHLVVEPTPQPATVPGRRRGRVLLPVAAAAALVAAVTVASVLITGQDRPTDGTAAGPPVSPAASDQTSPAAPVSGPAVDLVDLFQVGATGVVNHDFRVATDAALGAQTAYRWLGQVRTAVLTVVPASNIDATRIPRDRPVPIGTTTGYYSLFTLFPLDANTGPGSDKWLPHWTIAFQTPAGDWAFASVEQAMSTDDPAPGDASVDDPALIAAEYAASAVTFTPDAGRLAFRLGHLPAGLRAHGVSFDTGVSGPGAVSVSFTDGSASLHVQLLHPDSGAMSCSSEAAVSVFAQPGGDAQPGGGAQSCVPPLEREFGEYVLQVTSSGVDQAEAQRVLDGVEAAPDLDDRATYFPLADALG